MQKTQNVSQTCPKIKFSDEAISALKLKSNKRIQITFSDTPGSLNGLSLRYTPSTNKKVFELRYRYRNKYYRVALKEIDLGLN